MCEKAACKMVWATEETDGRTLGGGGGMGVCVGIRQLTVSLLVMNASVKRLRGAANRRRNGMGRLN